MPVIAQQKTQDVTYRDIDANFGIHPLTSDLNVITDDVAVKQSLKNLIMTRFFERKFHPEKGSVVNSLLFEPILPTTAIQISESIKEVIENYEPRVKLAKVDVQPKIDENGYIIIIAFFMVKQPTSVLGLTLFLEKVR